MNGVNCSREWAGCGEEEGADAGRDGARRKMRARQRLNAIVLYYGDGRAVLLPAAFSAPMMTIANL